MDEGAGGVRTRKREEARARVAQTAMRLFRERGYDATTVNEIASGAGVSRRSFFHYFASKEEVVLAWHDGIADALVAAAGAEPAGTPPMRVAEAVVLAVVGGFEHGEAAALARLIHDTPALRAGEQAKYERMESLLAEALARRGADGLRARLAAMAAVGALRVGSEAWLAGDGAEDPLAYVRRVFRVLREELAAD